MVLKILRLLMFRKKNEPEPTIDHPKVNDDDLDVKQEKDENPRESIPE